MKKQLLMASMILMSVSNHAQGTISTNTPAENTNQISATNENITNQNVTDQSTSNQNVLENVAYTLQKGDTLYASPKARFEIQGVDEQSGLKEVLVSLDGQEYATYKHPIAFFTEGNHSLSYQFIDRVGNISYSKNFDLIIDATPPRILEINFEPKPYLASGSIYVGPETKVSFIAHDDMTGLGFIEYSTNEQDFIKYSSNFSLSELGYTNNSVAQLYYRATDAVSNVSSVKSKTITIDAAAPTIEIFNVGPVFENNGVRYVSSKDVILIEAFDKETKVDQISYAINDGEFQEYNAEIGINFKESGQYKIRATAKDIVGNESEEIIYEVVVDMIAPTGSVDYMGVQKSDEYKDTIEGSTEMDSIPATPTEPAVQKDNSEMDVNSIPPTSNESASQLSQETNPGNIAPVSNP